MTLNLSLIVEILIFSTVVVATWFVGREIDRALEQRRRLGAQDTSAASSATQLLQGRGVENRFFQWVQESTSISEPAQRQKLRAELELAGFEGSAAPIWFVIIRFLLTIGGPLIFVLYRILRSQPLGGSSFIFGVALFAALGFIAPSFYVRQIASGRRT